MNANIFKIISSALITLTSYSWWDVIYSICTATIIVFSSRSPRIILNDLKSVWNRDMKQVSLTADTTQEKFREFHQWRENYEISMKTEFSALMVFTIIFIYFLFTIMFLLSLRCLYFLWSELYQECYHD